MIAGLILAVALTTASDPLDAPPTVRAPTTDEERRIIGLIEASGRLTVESGGVRFVNQRRLVEAREELAQAEELAAATYGPDHAVSMVLKARLGGLLLLLGQTDAARALLDEATAGLAALYPEDAPELADARERWLAARVAAGDDLEALTALEARHATVTTQARRLALAGEIAALHSDAGRTEAARPWMEGVRAEVLASGPEDAAWVGRPALTAGRFYLGTGDYVGAQLLFMTAAGAEAEMDRVSVMLIDAVLGLALAMQGQGRIDEAVGYLRDAQMLVRVRDEALGAGEGQSRTVFAGVFRQSVAGLWRMSDRIEARRAARDAAEKP